MGLSVADVLSGHVLRVFMENDVLELASVLRKARLVVGYNITRFDFKVLEGYHGVNLKAVRRLDLLEEIEAVTGFRVRLKSLQMATLQTTPRYHGMDAVRLWKEGRIADVIEAACNCVLAVKALHEIGCENGKLFHHPPDGERRKSINVKWR